MDNQQTNSSKDAGYYSSYAEFSKTLRTWFVAYGIGGPVVLLSSDTAWKTLVDAQCGPYIGIFFFAGIIIQIGSTLLNKHSMWQMYLEEISHKFEPRPNPPYKDSLTYKLSDWYSVQSWVDVLLDSYTLFLFGWATFLAFKVLSAKAGAEVCVPDDLSRYRIVIFGIMVLIFVIWFLVRLIQACKQGQFKKKV